VGVEPVPQIHLLENHSSALVAWRRAEVRDRILVHLDGHMDFDWLPDDTIARIAAASPDELPGLELHPYAMDGNALSRFGIWNWIYPAARLGMIRQIVWVVPDGTLGDRAATVELVRELFLSKIQMVSLDEARSLSLHGRLLQGTLLGLPVTVCELRDLPELSEPVLLDVDLDYFVTRSALTQEVAERPWIGPDAVVAALASRGLRADVATISLSTIGGYLPPECRWLGAAMQRKLRAPGEAATVAERERSAAEDDLAAGRGERAAASFRALAGKDAEDPTVWYSLADALGQGGREAEAAEAKRRAVSLDPVLAHDELFRGDWYWLNARYAEGLLCYRRYRQRMAGSPFSAYALRREAGCLMRLNRDDEAIAAFRIALQEAPEHSDSHLDLGAILRSGGRIGEAIRELETARRILPDRASYALALGTTYLVAGRLQDAAAHLEFAVERQPCLAMARNNLAAVLFQLGRYEESASQLRIAMTFSAAPNPQMRELATALRRRGVSLTRVAATP
jgi:tetratricopeptide (TPR) repeat protein